MTQLAPLTDYRYPAIKLPVGHGLLDQLHKVQEEAKEFHDEMTKYHVCCAAGDAKGAIIAFNNALVELCNVEHAIETARRIDPTMLVIAAQQTVEHNDERGYYDDVA